MRMTPPSLITAGLIGLLSLTVSAAGPQTQTFTMPIGDAFENGLVAFGVRLAPDGKGVVLYDRVLYEDDGPGLGSDAKWFNEDERSPTQSLAGETLFKKILVIDRPEALQARFCIDHGLQVTVNGQPLSAGPTRRGYPQCPPELLKKGANEIILKAPEGKTIAVKAARRNHIIQNAPERADLPPRSFKSDDGGNTWKPFDGEFFVRMQLIQHVPAGSLISPTIDLAQAGGNASGENAPQTAIQTPVKVAALTLKPDHETPEGTGIKYFLRTGASPVHETASWTTWQPAESPKIPPGHRYLQWKAELNTAHGTKTPLLKNMVIQATVAKDPPPAWSTSLKVAALQNAQPRYTSMPFKYEDPNSPKMKHLREKYKLDEVVAPGKTEFEKLILLRNWVATYWKYKPPEGHYPGWDADEILTLKYGFCVQYAITYMQCATALGYQARFVMGNNYQTGHEVAEVWSNEYRKWVFMDVNGNYHHINPKTGIPMTLLEVRDLILKTYYKGALATWTNVPKKFELSDEIATVYRKQFAVETPIPEFRAKQSSGGKGDKFYVPPDRWMAIRYVDRNNYLTQPYPQPRTEGSADWHYPGFWMWDDNRSDTQYRYRHNTARRSDIDWTINEVSFDAAYGAKPDTLAIQMATVTPYFETFVVNVDGKGWTRADRTLDWPLHPGKNRLEMRSRNTSGVEGPVSMIEVERR